MKKWKVLMLGLVLAFVCAACGGQETTGDESQVENAGDKEVSGETVKEEVKGYTFVYQDVTISVDALAAPIVDALGEPVSYFEAASCAFEGLDKMYTYNSVEIDTYPDEKGNDRVSSIILKDDMVQTPEGVYLFGTKADMIAAYGENYTEQNGLIVYEKDGMQLCFILENDEIVSIEYVSTVLE